MSVRRDAAQGPRVGRRSSRLDEVLRAGQERKAATTEADAEGLTQALKRTSLVPTGSCLPRNFDPDYCAYDFYYAVGVAVVSTLLGKLAASDAPEVAWKMIVATVKEAIDTQCYVVPPKEPDGALYTSPTPKRFYEMHRVDRSAIRQNFSRLCLALDETLQVDERVSQLMLEEQLGTVVKALAYLVLMPSAVVSHATNSLIFGRYPILSAMGEFPLIFIAGHLLNYISRYMNEHAMMIASFFRVNAKRLHANQPPLLNLNEFVRMCKEDIANGPNPAPPPPTAE